MSIPAATTYISRHETFISQQQLNATQESKRLNINIMATDTDSHASSGSQYLQDVLGDVLGTQHTVWKFQDFSVTQILREINFGESRSLKSAFLPFIGALNFVDLVIFSLNAKIHKNQNSEPLNVSKWQILHC